MTSKYSASQIKYEVKRMAHNKQIVKGIEWEIAITEYGVSLNEFAA